MENERITENEINILDMLFVVRKNIVKIIIAAVVIALIFLTYTLTLVTPLYQSGTQLLVKGISQEAMTIYPDSTSRLMLMNNCIEVLSGTASMTKVAEELSINITPEDLQTMVSISSPADTQVIKISAISPDPEIAREIAETVEKVSRDVLSENVGVSALSTIQKAKTPVAPVSPNPIKNTILGGFLGGVLAVAFYLAMWFINNRIHTPADAEKALGLTVFSSVPFVENEAAATNEKDNAKAKGGRN